MCRILYDLFLLANVENPYCRIVTHTQTPIHALVLMMKWLTLFSAVDMTMALGKR